MIFHKTLLREMTSTALATFLVLLGIVLATQLVRLLALAAGGAITSTSVIALLGLTLIGFLPTLLSLTLFVSVLMTISRAYRDSEMVVWFCSGVSLTRWVRPVLMFALPLVFTIGVLGFALSPWAAGKAEDYRKILDSRDDASAISPGVFRESRQADRVYFVEKVSTSDNHLANVFVGSTQHGKTGVMVAQQGFQEIAPNGDRFLVLMNGHRYEGEPGHADFKIYEFERYAVRIEMREAIRAPGTKNMQTLDLIEQGKPRHLGELSWRIGLPLSALLLALLAIPLAFVNPRAGRSMHLILAVLVYMIYVNLLSVIQASIAQSRLHIVPGLLLLHTTVALLLLALFYRRLSVFSLARLFK
jgi:lipopolysaccharide export system permease protein